MRKISFQTKGEDCRSKNLTSPITYPLALSKDLLRSPPSSERTIPSFSLFSEIAEVIQRERNVRKLAEQVLHVFMKLPYVRASGLLLRDKTRGSIRELARRGPAGQPFESMWDVQDPEDPGIKLVLAGEILEYPLKNGVSRERNSSTASENSSRVCIPLRSKNEIVGALELHLAGKKKLGDEEKRFYETVGRQLGLACDHAMLHDKERETKAKLNATIAKLSETNRELKQFIYTVSHDLKNPIVAIHGFASILKERHNGDIDPKLKAYIDRILCNAVLMEEFLKDLLELSRIGNVKENVQAVPLGEVVEKALEQHRYQIDEHRIRLSCSKRFPVLPGDRRILVRLFSNLISNAVKFRSPEKKPIISIRCRENKSHCLFWIKDNGIGIEKQDLTKVFDLFYRKESSKSEGHGLGLVICKRIVETHGGSIWVRSKPGEGSTFFFTLQKNAQKGIVWS